MPTWKIDTGLAGTPPGTAPAYCTGITSNATNINVRGMSAAGSDAPSNISYNISLSGRFLMLWGTPGVTSWPAGDWVLNLAMATTNMNASIDGAWVCRLNSSNTNIETLHASPLISHSLNSSTVQITMPQASAVTASATDRFLVVLRVAVTMTNQTFTIDATNTTLESPGDSGPTSKPVSDSLATTINDSIALNKTIPLSDSLAVEITDGIAITKQISVSDSVATSITDTINVLSIVPKPVSDSLSVDVTDSVTIQKQLALSDEAAVVIDDQIAIEKQISLSDSLAVDLDDQVSVDGSTPFGLTGIVETIIGGAGATSINANNASSPAEGDLLVAFVAWRGIGESAATDGGWTERYDFPDTVGPQLAIYTRPATNSEPSTYNFTFSGDATKAVAVIGKIPGGTLEALSAESSGNNTSPSFPSVSSSGEGRQVVYPLAYSHYPTYTAPSDGRTELYFNNTGGPENGAVNLRIATKTVGSGTVDAETGTLGVEREWRAVSIIIAPAPDAEPIDVSDSLEITIDDQIQVVNAVGLADDVAVALSDSIRKTSYWSNEVSATTFAAGESKEVSDSIAVALDDQIQIDKHIALSDDIVVNLDDQIALEKQLALTDDLSVTLVDEIHIEKQIALSDSVGVVVDDSIVVEKPIGLTDSLAVSIGDSIDVSSDQTPVGVSDSLSVAITDSMDTEVQTVPVDDLTVTINDQVAVVKQIALSDSLGVSITDSIAIEKRISVSDSLGVSINDQINVQKPRALTDALTVTISDSVNVSSDIVPKNVSDSLTISITDSVQVAKQSAVTVSDSLAVSITDSIAIQKQIALSDSLGVTIEDSISTDRNIALADSLAVTINDQANVEQVSVLALSDTLTATITDTVSVEEVHGKVDNNVVIELTLESTPDQSVVVGTLMDQQVVIAGSPDRNVTAGEMADVNVVAANLGDVTVLASSPTETNVSVGNPTEVGVTIMPESTIQVSI